MRLQTIIRVAAFTTLAIATLAAGQSVTFEMIPDALSASDMSPDGRWIVGETDVNGDGSPDGMYRWDTVNDVFLSLPNDGLDASAVSDDGQVILGCMPDPTGVGSEVAALWTAATGWQSIGFLPNAGACPSRSNGFELSADGTVATGLSWDGCDGLGFIWTAATGMQPLDSLANGHNRASAISADGTVIAGFAQGSGSRTPAMWDASGAGQILDPPDGDANGEIRGMSDDGTILLGNWDQDAVRWTAAGGKEVIGNGQMLPGWVGAAWDIADDATTVGWDFLLGNRRAWIQPQGVGPQRNFKTYVEANGGVVPDGLILEVCRAISTDGRYVVGHGTGTGACGITITPNCPGDTDGNGTVDIDDVVNVILCFGTDGVDCPSPGINTDVVPNVIVDIDDVIAVVLAFGGCPGT